MKNGNEKKHSRTFLIGTREQTRHCASNVELSAAWIVRSSRVRFVKLRLHLLDLLRICSEIENYPEKLEELEFELYLC